MLLNKDRNLASGFFFFYFFFLRFFIDLNGLQDVVENNSHRLKAKIKVNQRSEAGTAFYYIFLLNYSD